jgi:WD40 repeat protein
MAGNGVSLNTLAFQPGGNMLAAGGMDGVLRLWPNGLACQMMGAGAAQGQCLDMPQRFTAHTKPLRALAWSPDGRFLATGGDDNVLSIWYPAQSQKPLLSIPQIAPVLALSWSPDGKTIAAASGTTVTLWALS